ncbi:amidohydrolase [Halieaceae bacterium IMCC8485]|jgi:predicted TIM-barrel fold metal-dependent hydrolase|uniref:Amidohydrolase n=1 Tax=Candidatus Seongchinamella marina TaxID=2518990 RepID=A0ABT3SSR1_9GAMM|nr:amidohydrolase family protein [Candidatus Seongchinamella marina]MCX2972975.1 amidohydrolase [Candidatus Seongchinamella marina]
MTSTDLHFVDAHHHLWDLGHCNYPWLMAKGKMRFFGDPGPIQKNYLIDDFLAESPDYRPAKSVHIQVGVAATDEVKETAWLQSQQPYPHAIVAATDLRAKKLQTALEAHGQSDRLRGFRQILGRHELEDKKHGSDALLKDTDFLQGLSLLAAQGLSFDLQMVPPQMDQVVALFKQVPTLPVVLCHAGSPWDQSQAGLRSWREGLEKFAALPNTYCKLSGLGMFNPHWNEAALRPIILQVLDTFGPTRVMFGSNFPVDKLYNNYGCLWQTYDRVTANFSTTERQQMFCTTAENFYRI